MLGFPENPSDWGSKEYLRLFTIIMLYVSVRPLIQKLYERLGERQRQRDKKKTEEELIQRHKRERVQQKLGITPEEDPAAEEAAVREAAAEGQSSSQNTRMSLRNRRDARAARKQKSRKEEIIEEMPSDEDVSDLVS